MGRDGRRGGLISGVLGKGIGLAGEYREHRKEVKSQRAAAASNSQFQPSNEAVAGSSGQQGLRTGELENGLPSYEEAAGSSSGRLMASPRPGLADKKSTRNGDYDLDSDDALEQAWELDEAAEPPAYDDTSTSRLVRASPDDLVRDTLGNHAYHIGPIVRLPQPVILPQRRPGNRTRGFVRAYAPVLEPCGIDQKTFLSFLKNFHTASQSSPWISAVQVSAGLAGFAPGMIAFAVTTAVQIGAEVGKDMQERYRMNAFLNQINETLFKPAGLFAMILKHKPGNEAIGTVSFSADTVNLNTGASIARHEQQVSGGRSLSNIMSIIRTNPSETQGEIPEPAPLIYPALDAAIEIQGEETFKDKTRDFKKFMGNYMDKRAQMQYATNNPNSRLAVPESQRQFKSSLSDPNHPAFSGGLINLVSGGQLSKMKSGGQPQSSQYSQRSGGAGDYGSRPRSRRNSSSSSSSSSSNDHDSGYGGDRKERKDRRRHERRERRHHRGGDRDRNSWDSRNGYSNSYGNGYDNTPFPPAPYGQYSYPTDDSRSFGGNTNSASGGRPDAWANRAPSSTYSNMSTNSRGSGGSRGGGGERKGLIGMAKGLKKQDVLYLMIVNMPSESEMREAREQIEMSRGR